MSEIDIHKNRHNGNGHVGGDADGNGHVNGNGRTPKLPTEMTEEEFAHELKGSLLVLTTSSPDKRDEYRTLFTALAKDDTHHAGLDLFFTDSGALGLAPRKTPEKTGAYAGNLDEKVIQQLATLRDSKLQSDIRILRLEKYKSETSRGGRRAPKAHGLPAELQKNEFDPKTVKIMGMTEDSGMELVFPTKELEKRFIDTIIREIKPRLRQEDYWLLENLHKTGFPGPNFKPLQERLDGGFHDMMKVIYSAADELGLKELRFTQTVNVCFVSPQQNKFYKPKPFKASGRLLTHEEYRDNLRSSPRGEAVNINFVQVFDGQAAGRQDTVNTLIEKGLHYKSSAELPAQYARRDLTEYLQELVGKRRSTREERDRQVKIAFVDPDTMEGDRSHVKTETFGINDLTSVGMPTRSQLMRMPDIRTFDGADVIVLMPKQSKPRDNELRSDPNLALLLSFIVTAETEPEAMNVPLVLDNRSGGFDDALKVISDASAQGRFPMVRPPYVVANTDEEMKEALVRIKDLRQRAPIIRTPRHKDDVDEFKEAPLEKIPMDDVFTVFVGGGHANNSRRDIEDAKAFGMECAHRGWRIITGGGSVEGSMGAVHTGFVQYYLDQVQASHGNGDIKEKLMPYLHEGRYDAEKLILDKPEMVDELADKGLIPRDMFYCYSMKPLLEMESPSGQHPPGTTYFEAGNRMRRLSGLLASGTKVFLRGGIGTDEEFEETVRQHVGARIRKKNGVANDTAFSDGTPDDMGTMIIYNKDGHLDKLLAHYGLLGRDPVAEENRDYYRVKVVTNVYDLVDQTSVTERDWKHKISNEKAQRAQNGDGRSAVRN